MAYIINRIVFAGKELKTAIRDCIDYMKKNYDSEEAKDIYGWMGQAIGLSGYQSDGDNLFEYNLFKHSGGDKGGGWTGSSALYIALYFAVTYEHDFDKAIQRAVNYSEDSDSVGAITGNIVGAICGYDSISEKWKTNLELHDVILEVTDDLFSASSTGIDHLINNDEKWIKKYVKIQRA